MSSVEFAPLSPENDLARRVVFMMTCVANRFGLPLQSRPDVLIECAMEQPEVVTPEEYRLIYMMRSQTEVVQ